MAAHKSTPEQIAKWRLRTIEHQESGLSAKEYCKEHGLNEKTFSSWKRRLAAGEGVVKIKVNHGHRNDDKPFNNPIIVNATLKNGLLATIECGNPNSFSSTIKVLNSL